jgi:amidase
MGFAEYGQFDGLGLAELVAAGEVTPAELVEEAYRRIEATNPKLGAVVHQTRDHANRRLSQTLSGPFAGVPFLLKDLLATLAGEPMKSGSRIYGSYVPSENSEMVERFQRAGVVVVGKTSTPEFGLTPYTEAEVYGPCRNPWDLERTSGGSSGGSAAAVAAGVVPMASAGDGGGSIRIPASCCGIFGLKPSRGRNPQGPVESGLWASGVCEHIVSRSVRDSAAMLDAVSGRDVGAPYFLPAPPRPFAESAQLEPGRMRIAYSAEPYLTDRVHPDCIKATEDAVGLLRELGHEVVEDRADIDGLEFGRSFLLMLASELYASMRDAERDVGRRASKRDFEEVTRMMGFLASTFSAGQLCQEQRNLFRTGRKYAAFVERYDAVLSPVLAMPPVKIGELAQSLGERVAQHVMALGKPLGFGRLFHALGGPKKAARENFAFAGYTPIQNSSGTPAMSVPLYWNDDGLPIGVMFSARLGDEGALLSLAGQLERARPWTERRPQAIFAG